MAIYDDYGNELDMGSPSSEAPATRSMISGYGGSNANHTTDFDPYSGEQPYNPGTFTAGGAGTIGAGGGGIGGDITSAINGLFGTNLSGAELAKRAAVLGGGLAGAAGLLSPKTQKVGYQGGIPKYTATRNMVTAPPTRAQGYRPGQGGINYGGDVTYTPTGGLSSAVSGGSSGSSSGSMLGDIAKVAGGAGVAALLANYLGKSGGAGNIASILKGIGGGLGTGGLEKMPNATAGQPTPGQLERDDAAAVDIAGRAPDGIANEEPFYMPDYNDLPPEMPTYDMPEYNIQPEGPTLDYPTDFDYTDWSFAKGGSTGRYLQGETDGMADKIPARIGRDQPAALSHGEFVVPADVVSHLGNGNSDAGADKLYQMMDKIRQARTGTKKQGKKINPDKFMPGGLAQAYANGGSVKHFVTGGTTLPAGTTGQEQGLANWAGEYTTDMLGKGQALANAPYQQYMGPLTAGESGLQSKVFGGLQGTNFPGNLGASFSSTGAYQAPAINMDAYKTQPIGTGPASAGIDTAQPAATVGAQPTTMFDAQANQQQPQGIASQYMNPYLQSVLTPQMEELRRQAQINNMSGLGALTKSGAFGGGRQAIMESEAGRNLLQEQNKALSQGYASAFDRAQQQFNTEQNQGMGLAKLMSDQGAQQRGIEAEGIAADKAAFEAARENPYKMVQFQQSLLSGMPISATNYTMPQQDFLTKAAGGATTVNTLLNTLGLGTPTGTAPAAPKK